MEKERIEKEVRSSLLRIHHVVSVGQCEWELECVSEGSDYCVLQGIKRLLYSHTLSRPIVLPMRHGPIVSGWFATGDEVFSSSITA